MALDDLGAAGPGDGPRGWPCRPRYSTLELGQTASHPWPRRSETHVSVAALGAAAEDGAGPSKFPGPADHRTPRYRQTFYDSPASFHGRPDLWRTGNSGEHGDRPAGRLRRRPGPADWQQSSGSTARREQSVPARLQAGGESALPLQPPSDRCRGHHDRRGRPAVRTSARLADYMIAYCDPLRRRELVARIGRERGTEPDIGACFVNDRRMQHRQEPGEHPPGPAEVLAARPSTLTEGIRRNQDGGERCYLHINNAPGDHTVRAAGRHARPVAREHRSVPARHRGSARRGGALTRPRPPPWERPGNLSAGLTAPRSTARTT